MAWTRVFAGIIVATCGTIWAHGILEFVLDASEGKLNLDSNLQAKLVTWEITALAMLVGSALAGATTQNCLKQGLCVGMGVIVILIGFRMSKPDFMLEELILTVMSSVLLCIVGGWFGGQLFPPILVSRHRKGVGPTAFA